jgi:hypothetical protein
LHLVTKEKGLHQSYTGSFFFEKNGAKSPYFEDKRKT